MKQHGYHARDQHDHCQILNETDGMHGVGSLMTRRADRRQTFCASRVKIRF
jgi:hypothetical protein